MITILKKTRGKNTFEQDTKMKDKGAGHITERGSKLSVPLFSVLCGICPMTIVPNALALVILKSFAGKLSE